MKIFIKNCFWVIITAGFVSGCSTGPEGFNNAGQWQEAGLEKAFVNILEVEDETIVAGTSEGVFKQADADLVKKWDLLGLASDSSQIVDLVVFGGGQIWALEKYFNPDTTIWPLYETNNGGKTWSRNYSTEVEEVSRYTLVDIEQHPDRENVLFANRGLLIKSTDSGNSWQVYPNNITAGFPEFLFVSSNHPNQIWVGGMTNIYSPHLAKSEDGGQTWKTLNQNVYTLSDGMARDVILHHNNPDKVLAAVYGISRSGDGGESWEPVFDSAGISTIGRSARNPKVVYASGIKRSGNLFFAATRNFGDHWEIVEWEEGPSEVQVNDMVSVVVGGQEVLYFGTNKGVYSYRFED